MIKRVVDDYQIQRIFLPPYSPDFNPLESLFHNVKGKLPKREIRSAGELRNEIEKCLGDMSG